MDSIEQAIRNALGKGNAEDPAFRERVYRSAQAALERAVLANQSIPADAVARRRKQFLDTIARIESDYYPAAEAQVEPPAPVSTIAPSVDAPRVESVDAARQAPAVDLGERRAAPSASRAEPSFDDERRAAPPAPPRHRRRAEVRDDDYAQSPPRRRRSFPWGLIVGLTTLAVIAGLAYWAAVEFGLLNAPGQGAQSGRPAQNSAGSSEAPARPGDNDPLSGWLPVFSPSDPTTVAASPGARAEVVTEDGRQVMRISSGSGGAPLRFDIGAGVLERLAGKRAVFDIVARAGSQATQMSVTCALGKSENCGRNRYTVGVEQSEYLFEVEVPAGAGGEAGAIEIVADVSNGGKTVDIVEIRVQIAEARQ